MHSTRFRPKRPRRSSATSRRVRAVAPRPTRIGRWHRPSATPSSRCRRVVDRIAADLGDDPRRGDVVPPSAVDAAHISGAAPAGTEESEEGGDELAGARRRRQSGRARRVAIAVASVAAVVIALLAFSLSNANNKVSQLRDAMSGSGAGAALALRSVQPATKWSTSRRRAAPSSRRSSSPATATGTCCTRRCRTCPRLRRTSSGP